MQAICRKIALTYDNHSVICGTFNPLVTSSSLVRPTNINIPSRYTSRRFFMGDTPRAAPQFITIRSSQTQFVGRFHAFNLCFSFPGAAPGMTAFQVHQFCRLAPSEILGAAPIGVLGQTSLNVSGNTCIKRIV